MCGSPFLLEGCFGFDVDVSRETRLVRETPSPDEVPNFLQTQWCLTRTCCRLYRPHPGARAAMKLFMQ